MHDYQQTDLNTRLTFSAL